LTLELELASRVPVLLLYACAWFLNMNWPQLVKGPNERVYL